MFGTRCTGRKGVLSSTVPSGTVASVNSAPSTSASDASIESVRTAAVTPLLCLSRSFGHGSSNQDLKRRSRNAATPSWIISCRWRMSCGKRISACPSSSGYSKRPELCTSHMKTRASIRLAFCEMNCSSCRRRDDIRRVLYFGFSDSTCSFVWWRSATATRSVRRPSALGARRSRETCRESVRMDSQTIVTLSESLAYAMCQRSWPTDMKTVADVLKGHSGYK